MQQVRRGSGNSRARILGAAAAAATLSAALPAPLLPTTAWAQSSPSAAEVTFDIPAQDLNAALLAFAERADVQVFFDSAKVSGLRSSAVRDNLTPEAALAALLAGTGVSYRFTGPDSVTIERNDASGALNLSPVMVQGRGLGGGAWGPVDGYAASRTATGTKTDTPIIDIPASIEVVPREVIDDQAALNLKDVYKNVSGVQEAGNTLNAQTEVLPIIRGFDSPTLLRDGLRSTQVGAVDLVNVERVEVLKGPASILYGALEPGGVVNTVLKRPQAETMHRFEQQVGSDRLLRSTLDTTGSLVEDDTLLYRLNAAYTNSHSFRDHVHLERVAVAPSLLWEPTIDTELLLDLSYVRETQPYDAGVPLDENGDPLVRRSAFFGDPGLNGRVIDDYWASYQLSHQVNPVWTLRNQLSAHRAHAENESLRPRGLRQVGDDEVLLMRYQNEDRTDDELQFVLDATAEFDTGAVGHTLLIGGELLGQKSDFRRFRTNVDPVVVTSDPHVRYTPPSDQPQEKIEGRTGWAAAYVQDQISLLDGGRLKLLVGGRFDWVRQENKRDGVSSPDVEDRALTGRAGLLYELTPNLSPYVSVTQSFQPQSSGTLDANGDALEPERGLQYETGLKAQFFGERLLATASLFQIEKDNVAVLDRDLFNATGQIAYFPGVKQRSRGVEFDLSGALTDEINIIANYAYIDAEVTKNDDDPATEGERLGGVPRHTAHLWMTYNFREGSRIPGLGFGSGVRYVGENTAQFDTDVRLDSYAVVDLAAWYRWESLKLSVNVNNLFDENYVLRASDAAIAHPGAPRSIIGSLSLDF